jgi:hypothetical protein
MTVAAEEDYQNSTVTVRVSNGTQVSPFKLYGRQVRTQRQHREPPVALRLRLR